MNPIEIERLYGMLMRLEVSPEEYERRVGAVMSSEDFVQVHNRMRKFICDTARKFTKCPEEQKYLIQEACLHIAEMSPASPIDFLELEVFRAINNAYSNSPRRRPRREEDEIRKRRREIIGEISRRQRKGV